MVLDQAAVVELPRLRELPDDDAGLARRHVREVCCRAVMHLRAALHHLRVRFELLPGAEHHLVHALAGVDDHEAHRFTGADRDLRGREFLRVAHLDDDGAPDPDGISRTTERRFYAARVLVAGRGLMCRLVMRSGVGGNEGRHDNP